MTKNALLVFGSYIQLFGSWTSSPWSLFSNDFHFQGQTFPAVLNDSGLSGQSSGAGQQVILVSHPSQATNGASDNGYSVSVLMLLDQAGQNVWLVEPQNLFVKFDRGAGPAAAAADGVFLHSWLEEKNHNGICGKHNLMSVENKQKLYCKIIKVFF